MMQVGKIKRLTSRPLADAATFFSSYGSLCGVGLYLLLSYRQNRHRLFKTARCSKADHATAEQSTVLWRMLCCGLTHAV